MVSSQLEFLKNWDDFNFSTGNFSFPSNNIPSAPAYSVYVSQLIHYARACSEYHVFIEQISIVRLTPIF